MLGTKRSSHRLPKGVAVLVAVAILALGVKTISYFVSGPPTVAVIGSRGSADPEPPRLAPPAGGADAVQPVPTIPVPT